MGLPRIVSEINGKNRKFFHICVLNVLTNDGDAQKLEGCLYQMVETFDDMFVRFGHSTSVNQSINQSISLIASLRPESRIANDMQLK